MNDALVLLKKYGDPLERAIAEDHDGMEVVLYPYAEIWAEQVCRGGVRTNQTLLTTGESSREVTTPRSSAFIMPWNPSGEFVTQRPLLKQSRTRVRRS